MFSGCAYYNYFFNAQKNFETAEKQRRDTPSRGVSKRASSNSGYAKSVASAEKMLEYYPGSRWDDDALLLIAKSNYYDGKYRSAAGRVDELLSRFPESLLVEEARLYKGLSLLRLAQPDSARQILGEIFLNSSNKSNIAQGHFGLGEYNLLEKRPEVALSEFRIAAQSAVDDVWLRGQSWVKAGETLSLLKRYGEAVDLYNEILGEKIPRRLRFEASFQRASALRESGHAEEAFEECKILLKDGAFVDDFPMVELEAAKSLRAIGRNEEAKERLEDLVETEKRGEIGAEGQYQLGLLHWEINRDDTAALSALQAVKATERTAKIVPMADSLAAEIAALMKHYQKLRFYSHQFSMIDSARQGFKQIYPSDTVWVDSSLLVKNKIDKSKDRSSKKKKGDIKGKTRPGIQSDPNDPIGKMIEDAMAADPTGRANLLDFEPKAIDTTARDSSAKSAPQSDTLKVPLDSLQLCSIESSFHSQQQSEWLSLAELHLFDRNDIDSASYYIDTLLATDLDSILWARSIATAAYIFKSHNDTLAYDSLYGLILANPPDKIWRERAEKALRIEVKLPPTTQTAALIDSAEAIWRDQNDVETARLLYLLAAEVADSGDTAGARGLLAAAFITRTVLGQDSLANQLYAEVSSKFSGTTYAKLAQKRSPKNVSRTPSRAVPQEPKKEDAPSEDYPDAYLDDRIPNDTPAEPVIYEANKVDEIPLLITSSQVLDDYLRSYYPFEAYGERMNGHVEVSLVVRANGEVTDVEINRADPEGYGFDDAATQVITMLAYRPGRKNGTPVDVRIKQSFEFKFQGDR